MRSLAIDSWLQRKCLWDGTPNASSSSLIVNGTTIRKNLENYPQATQFGPITSNSAGLAPRWGGNGGTCSNSVVNGSTPISRINTFVRKTWSVIGTGFEDVGFAFTASGTNGLIVEPNEVVSVSCLIRSSWSEMGTEFYRRAIQIKISDINGNIIGNAAYSNNVPKENALANVWNTVSGSFTMPANAKYVEIVCYIKTANVVSTIPIGSTLDITAIYVGKGLNTSYFDGYSTGLELLAIYP